MSVADEIAGTADPKRELLRHMLATVAYRARKILTGASDDFGVLSISESSRTPAQILAHVCDLYDWALWLAKGEHVYRESTPQAWNLDVDRFFACIKDLDDYLASSASLGRSPEQIFQGPIADSLAHIGQLAMLRRLDGVPVRGESYLKADITVGRVGQDQAPPKWEFD